MKHKILFCISKAKAFKSELFQIVLQIFLQVICDFEKKIFHGARLEKGSILWLYCCINLTTTILKCRFLFFTSKYSYAGFFYCCFPHTGSSECYPTCFYHPNSVLSKAVQRAMDPFRQPHILPDSCCRCASDDSWVCFDCLASPGMQPWKRNVLLLP